MKSMFSRGQWKLLRGDNVIIRAGKDAGQTGIISKVDRDLKNPGVIVKGMNLVMPSTKTVTNIILYVYQTALVWCKVLLTC